MAHNALTKSISNTMGTSPEIMTRYFDAANHYRIDDASDCFALNAFVHDEQRDHIGREAIRAWIEETTLKYRPAFEVRRADITDGRILLSVSVSGDFSGSPVEPDYDITLRDGKISSLLIQ